MASEVTAPSSGAQDSVDKQLSDSVIEQLVNALKPRESIVTISFVAAREICGNILEPLKASLAEHFSKHFKASIREVNLSVDILDNNIMVTPVDHASPTSVSDVVTPPAAHNTEDEAMTDAGVTPSSKVPRPPNSFIMYRKDLHPTVVAANPGLHNNDISKIIGAKWKAEDQEVRDEYTHKAAEAKRQHLLANPGYQYQPRKPSQKKKRMTKNKIAKLAAKSAHKSTATKPSANLLDIAGGLIESDMFKPAPVVPVLTFDEGTLSFNSNEGATEQLSAELAEFLKTPLTAAQNSSIALAQTIREAERGTLELSMQLARGPAPTSTPNLSTDTELLALDDFNVGFAHNGVFGNPELFRQIDLQEAFKDEMSDLFDFEGFNAN